MKKCGNRLIIDPTTAKIKKLLEPALSYVEKKYRYGKPRWSDPDDEVFQDSKFDFIPHQCFAYDHKRRLYTSFGFHDRIKGVLSKAGYKPRIKDYRSKDPNTFKPDFDAVLSFAELRYKQDEILYEIATNYCGRIDCHTGYGKSFLICLIAKLFPKAKIDVVTKDASVVGRLYKELVGMMSNVGAVGGGYKKKGRRVTIYCAHSLSHSPGDADLLLGDECHQLAADKFAPHLARYAWSRNFGFSATHDMRLDNKDMRLEGIFGPVILKISYEEGMKEGLVVPIEVKWTDVDLHSNPCGNLKDVAKKRAGIWRNFERNELIAKDARLYGDGDQVLITVEVIDHAVRLKQLLPEFTLVYAAGGMADDKRAGYIRDGFISRDEPKMSIARKRELEDKFEKGELKKVIATTVWNTGVDFRKLQVLIRADAGGSSINNTQIPGRVSRTEESKRCGILHDYVDSFDYGFYMKSRSRWKDYEAHGWSQTAPRSLVHNKNRKIR